MDPEANTTEQLQLAEEILYGGQDKASDAERLAELVVALHEWMYQGGFSPRSWGNRVALSPRGIEVVLQGLRLREAELQQATGVEEQLWLATCQKLKNQLEAIETA